MLYSLTLFIRSNDGPSPDILHDIAERRPDFLHVVMFRDISAGCPGQLSSETRITEHRTNGVDRSGHESVIHAFQVGMALSYHAVLWAKFPMAAMASWDAQTVNTILQ